jgi:tRNA A-37 threonylcarbamoyl transferase component Bud32
MDSVMIYDTAVDFHLAGVHHGDLVARNFVRDKQGRLSIVDFGHAAVDHACEPEVCPELSDLRQNLGL